jgi:ribose 5-phosphate isomerase B
MVDRIAIGSDHAGFQYKEAIKRHLMVRGIPTKDFGTYSLEDVDYPDFIRPVAEAVARGEFPAGIVLGGSRQWRGDGGKQGTGRSLRVVLG